MPAHYEVLETGIYEDSRTGLRYRCEAGKTIDVTHAYYLGMPGAVLPETARSGEGPNLIADGGFDAGIAGWWGYYGEETLTHETGSPPGALKVVTTDSAEGQGAMYPDGGALAVAPGDRILIRFTIIGDAPTLALALTWPPSGNITVWTATLLPLVPQAVVLGPIVVPAAAIDPQLVWQTTIAQAKLFFLDDVELLVVG